MTHSTFKRSLLAIAVVSSLSMVAPQVLAASNTDGAIQGTVTSGTSAPVLGAKITIKNQDTGLVRTIESDGNGKYRIPRLPIGQYTLTIAADGYDDKVVENIPVTIGSSSNITTELHQVGMERLAVVGSSRIASIDTTSSEAALVISQTEIERLPLPKDITSVALLAPGTTRGDGRFGNFASFGGASVAENAFYINGLNVTNFRNGLGFSNVPFDFYEQFEVKTGGYGAEFGRSTGGVVNAVTKSGSNNWEFGGNVRYRPDALSSTSPDSYNPAGDIYTYNGADAYDKIEGNVYASGPLIKDKLFFYAMYQPRSTKQEYAYSHATAFSDVESDNPFWGLKLDWNITDNHTLEFLGFSDKNDNNYTNYEYDFLNKEVGMETSKSVSKSGGDNYVFTYTGQFTDTFSARVLYGVNEYNLTSSSNIAGDCNLIYDLRASAPQVSRGCASAADYFQEEGNDKRKEFRADFEWLVAEDHTLKFGYDQEVNTSHSNQFYSGPGGVYWFYYDTAPGTVLANGATVPAGVTQYARSRERTVGGDFEVNSQAIYLEDTWAVTDTVTLSLGLRWDSFDNMNSEGESFVKIDDMIAPRMGVSWDINGDGESKLFANVGRYFLPVASNTNVRLAGNEFDAYRYYALNGTIDQDINGTIVPTPDLGAQIGGDLSLADGTVPDTSGIVDQELDPMYQDEIIIGYQAMIDDTWSWGIKGTQRKLNGAIDDMTISHWTEAKYGCAHPGGGGYVLGNPGEDMTVKLDTDCDGAVDSVETIPGNELGYPSAERTYNAVDLTLNRAWTDDWSMSATYTWSQSYGNTEGLVKSDNAQGDAGLTQDFDFPELMDGADGYLPNDRRHMFKLFGAYAITDSLTVGANLSVESGRPLNKFGIGHPVNRPDYGDTYYTLNSDGSYSFNPRGSAGRTDWVYRLDLSASYTMEVSDLDVVLKANVYNVLNSSATTRQIETFESGDEGMANPDYGTITGYQTPRYVEFSASVKF
ncbi:TonB-dependent receptor [Shewanella sp. Isolate11]|uniref:TonB-dependent receptor n=1 Tax=Shewanella sp. Isolate11 TaxID=2908530 RepID=UPI001EFD0234|nr:TonB-dependent receptor [Shewanella sp. Isolate11]MCG9697473.1 TonB-dependent receptor [Shewanella sp. Isolate11]